MVLLIHGKTSYEMAMKKYKFWAKAPENFPVLVVFEPVDPDEDDYVSQGNVAIVQPSQALKLLSSCTTDQLKTQDGLTMTKVASILQPWANLQPVATKAAATKTPSPSITAVDEFGESVVLSSFPAMIGMVVGQQISVGNKPYTVTQVVSSIPTIDPVTGEPMDVEVVEDEKVPTVNIPGVEEIPIDPGKFQVDHAIAEMADPTEHVLDVERAV